MKGMVTLAVRHFVQLDFSRLNEKQRERFIDLFKKDEYRKHIYLFNAKTGQAVIYISLFNTLQYKLEKRWLVSKLRMGLLYQDYQNADPEIAKQLKYEILQHEDEDAGKDAIYFENIRPLSRRYDHMVRKIRF